MHSMARILVTEEIAESGLQRLSSAGHVVDVQLGLSRGELLATVPGAAAVIIRSATMVDAELLAAADKDIAKVYFDAAAKAAGRNLRAQPA